MKKCPGWVAAQDRGQQPLKNIAELVRVYALSPAQPATGAPHTAVMPRLSIWLHRTSYKALFRAVAH